MGVESFFEQGPLVSVGTGAEILLPVKLWTWSIGSSEFHLRRRVESDARSIRVYKLVACRDLLPLKVIILFRIGVVKEIWEVVRMHLFGERMCRFDQDIVEQLDLWTSRAIQIE